MSATATHAPDVGDDAPLPLVEAVRRAWRDQRASLLVLVLVVLVGAGAVVAVAVRFPDRSVYDEAAHVDYVRRAERLEVPRLGDRLSPQTVDVLVCRDGREGCAAAAEGPAQLGADGYQYQAQQPPLYYLVTAALRRLVALGPSGDLLLTSRLTGAAWLGIGLAVLWTALLRLRVRPAALATILVVALVSPAGLYHSSTVTNDAALLLLGSLALHYLLDAAGPASGARVASWSAVAAAAVWTKPQIVLAFAAMGLAAALRRDRPGRRPVSDDLWALPVVVGGLAYLAWSAVASARSTVDSDVVYDALLGFKQTDAFPVEDALAQLDGLVGAYLGPTPLTTGFVAGVAALVLYVIVASDLRAVLERGRATFVGTAAGVSLLATVLAGPAFTALFFLEWEVGGGPSPRYGLVLLPGMLLGLVDVTRHRGGRTLVQVLAAALAVALLALIADPALRLP